MPFERRPAVEDELAVADGEVVIVLVGEPDEEGEVGLHPLRHSLPHGIGAHRSRDRGEAVPCRDVGRNLGQRLALIGDAVPGPHRIIEPGLHRHDREQVGRRGQSELVQAEGPDGPTRAALGVHGRLNHVGAQRKPVVLPALVDVLHVHLEGRHLATGRLAVCDTRSTPIMPAVTSLPVQNDRFYAGIDDRSSTLSGRLPRCCRTADLTGSTGRRSRCRHGCRGSAGNRS